MSVRLDKCGRPGAASDELPARIACVHEWLTDWGGSEDVLLSILDVLPTAELFATIEFLAEKDRRRLKTERVHTTFIQKLPFAKTRFWHYLPLTALAVESLDVGSADLIVSSSHAFAKGVITRADQLHVSYVHSPMRYAWDLHHEYMRDYGLERGLRGLLARRFFQGLRQWDRNTANNVDLLLANSRHVQQRIWRAYRRPSLLVYPPVKIGRWTLQARKEEYYITVSRLVSYKRVDLIVDAFRGMPHRKLVVIGAGPELDKLRRGCPANVDLMGWQPDAVVQEMVGAAKAFIFAAHEDFGISPVDAQACGTPVIAYGCGGAVETVRDLRSSERPTGLLFAEQSARGIHEAVAHFERQGQVISANDCRAWAENFSEERFTETFKTVLQTAWRLWCRSPDKLDSLMQVHYPDRAL